MLKLSNCEVDNNAICTLYLIRTLTYLTCCPGTHLCIIAWQWYNGGLAGSWLWSNYNEKHYRDIKGREYV